MWIFGLDTPGPQTSLGQQNTSGCLWLKASTLDQTSQTQSTQSLPNEAEGFGAGGHPLPSPPDCGLSALQPPCSKGSRSVFWANLFFGGLGCRRPNSTHLFMKRVVFLFPCRLRRQGQTTIRFWEMCGFVALVPQASNKTSGSPWIAYCGWIVGGAPPIGMSGGSAPPLRALVFWPAYTLSGEHFSVRDGPWV